LNTKPLGLACLTICAMTALACLSRGDDDPVGRAGRPIRIAVIPFPLASGTPTPPVDVAEVICADLASTGRFAPMTSQALPSRPRGLAEIEFARWRSLGTDFVVIGLVAIVHDGGHEVEFRLVDIRKELSVVGFVVPSAPDQLEATARKIARIIDERLAMPESSMNPSHGRARLVS
jgi:Tol biopolymer transport system component